MGLVYFTADTHFGHRTICKYRPEFSSPAQHDEVIIDNWNKTVKKSHDIVWVLGDVVIKNKDYDFDSILNRLRGIIRIIVGNHDDIHYYKTSALLNKRFHLWNGMHKAYGYWLTHAPIHPDELRGKKNIHGHVHNKTIPDDRYINVCVDNIGYTPVSLEEIRNGTRRTQGLDNRISNIQDKGEL